MNTSRDWASKSKKSGFGKRIMATVAVVIGASVILAGTAALAAGRQASTGGRGFQSGTFGVAFTDASGRPTSEPNVSVSHAAPGMAPANSTFTLRNTGTVAAGYTVTTTGLAPSGHSLDEVLVVTARSDAGQTLYRGKLSGLTFSEDELGAGQTQTYELSITWPATPNDNAYQGQSLTFGLRADAAPASR